MMTSSLIDDISVELLVCRICLDQFRRPKTLSCRHTFCEECLEKLRDAEEEDDDNRRTSRRRTAARLTCPVCNARSVIPPGGVRRLPDDPVVARLSDVVERRRSTSASRPSASGGGGSAASTMWCDICSTAAAASGSGSGGASSGSKRRRTAQCRCLECAKLLCSACVRLHRRTNVTSGHSLIDLETDISTTCGQHGPDEQLRFYCETCDSCVCVLCTYDALHAGHDVLSFAEAVRGQRGPLVARVERCRDRLERVRSRLQAVEAIDDDLRKAEDRIREAAMETVTYVRRRERELLSALKSSVTVDQPGDHGEPVIANGDGGGGASLAAQRRSLTEEARQLSSVVESAERLLDVVGADGRGAAPFLLARRQLVDSIDGLLPQSSAADSAAAIVVEDSRLPEQRISFVPFGIDSTLAVSLGQISVRSVDDVIVDGGTNVDECSSVGDISRSFLPPIAPSPPSRPKSGSSRGAESSTPLGTAVDVESLSLTTPTTAQAVVIVQEEIHRVPVPPRSSSRTVEMQENEIWIDVYFEDVSVQTDDDLLTSTNGVGNRCEASGGSPSLSASRRQSLTTSRSGTAGQDATGSSPTAVRRRLQTEPREILVPDGVGSGTDSTCATDPFSSDVSSSSAGFADTSTIGAGVTSTSTSQSTLARQDQATSTEGLVSTRDDWTCTIPPHVVSTGTDAEVRTSRSQSVDAMPLPPPPVTSCAETMTDRVGTDVDERIGSRTATTSISEGRQYVGENLENVDDGGKSENVRRQSDVIAESRVLKSSTASTSTISKTSEGQHAGDVTDVGRTRSSPVLADSKLHPAPPTLTDSQSVQQTVTQQQAEAVQPVVQLLSLLPEIARTADVLAASHFSSGLTAVLLRDVAAIGLRLAASFARNSRDVATDTADDAPAEVFRDTVVQQGNGGGGGGGGGMLQRSLSAGSSQPKTQSRGGRSYGNDAFPEEICRRCQALVSCSSKAVQTELTTPRAVVDRGCGEATVIVVDQSTSTPLPPAVFDKETSTSNRHQIHKSVATDSLSTADKQTWMAIDVASAYLNSMATTRRSVSVSRGTNTLPFLPAPAAAPRVWTSTADRASSPIRPAVADKAVTANRAEALEPLDTFPSPVGAAGVPPGSPRGRRTPLSLSPRSKLACISEGAEHCREELGDADDSGSGGLTPRALPPLSSINSRLMTRSLNRLPNRDVEALLHGRPTTPRSAGGLHHTQPPHHHHPLAMSTSSSLPILRTVTLNRNVFDFENLLNVRASAVGRLGSTGAGGEEPAAAARRSVVPSLASSLSPAAPPPSPPSVQEREDPRQTTTGVVRSAPATPTGSGFNCELLSAMLTELSRDRAVAPPGECDGTNSPPSRRSASSN